MASVLRVGRGAWRMCMVALLATPALALLSACREPADRTVIAVLTPDAASTLAAEPGGSAFRDRVAARCPDCVIADGYDGATPADARQAVADGADVVVVQARTTDLGEDVVAAAGAVPVVAFERFVPGADWFVSYDRTLTGVAVADVVAQRLDGRGPVLLLAGSPVDTDTDVLEQGFRDGLEGHEVAVAGELDAATGTADEARDWVEDQLDQPGGRAVEAVLAVSDEQARGVMQAFESAGLARPWPIVAGAGGDLEAVRRVVGGDQTLTVHMPVARTAERAADVALSLVSAAGGEDLTEATEVGGVAAYVFEPVVVSVASVTETVVRDGTYSPEEICAGDLVDACADLGIR